MPAAVQRETEQPLDQLGVLQPGGLGRARELLVAGDLGVGIGLEEEQRPVGRQAEVEPRVAVQLEDPVDAPRDADDRLALLGREVLGRLVGDADLGLVLGGLRSARAVAMATLPSGSFSNTSPRSAAR